MTMASIATTLSAFVTWRNLFILLCVLNAKSVPFSWHLRLFYQFVINVVHGQRLLSRIARNKEAGKAGLIKQGDTHPIFKSVSIFSRTPLYEIDYNLHKSNSTYFVDLDESRTALVAKLYGPGLVKGGDRALEKEGYDGRLSVVLGSVHTTFHKEIKAYERYEVRSRVLGWDKKWVVIISFFIRPATKKNKEVLLASSLSKYVVKKKRFTVSPERCLRAAGWLPQAPEEPKAQESEQKEEEESIESGSSAVLVGRAGKIATSSPSTATKESATPQSDNEVDGRPVPDTAIAAAEVLESLSNAVTREETVPASNTNTNQEDEVLARLLDEPKADKWDWHRIEAERIRGLEKVRAWLALDTMLKEEYESGLK